jgi:hypothetical protein
MNNFTDVVGKADLYCGSNIAYTYDRFCNPNSAIYFSKGYLQIPPGVYFSGDFTVTAWINLRSYQSRSRIIDFGNGPSVDSIVFYFKNHKLMAYIRSRWIESSASIELNQWYHVAFVLSGTNGIIYVNGSLAANDVLYVPNDVKRSSNYIGKSNWNNNDRNADAVYDDLKIYNEALSAESILNEFTITSYSNG